MSANPPGSYYYQGLLMEGMLLGSLLVVQKEGGKAVAGHSYLFSVEKSVLLK